MEYRVKRNIEYMEFCTHGKNVYCAFKETIVKGEDVFISEGIALKCDLETVTSYHGITSVSKYYLYQKEIETVALENMFWEGDTHNKFEECRIKEPYTYLLRDGKDVALYNVSWYDYSIYDIEGNKLPTAICFDYIQSHMHDGNFDLSVVIEILKKRSDIKFIKEVKRENIVYTNEPKIFNIPYYNCEANKHHYLYFVWMPSAEDFSHLKSLSSFNFYDKIYDDIFKIPRLPQTDEENQEKE